MLHFSRSPLAEIVAATAFVLDDRLEILFADDRAPPPSRFSTGDGAADGRLRLAIERGVTTTIAVPGQGARLALAVSTVPLRASRGVADRPVAAVFAEPVRPASDPVAETAADARLTGAETGVLALIFKGFSTIEAARLLSVAPSTVRSHLKAIFAKTGTSRQSELVHHVATVAAAPFRQVARPA